jgi:hypothetical protein
MPVAEMVMRVWRVQQVRQVLLVTLVLMKRRQNSLPAPKRTGSENTATHRTPVSRGAPAS